MHQVAQRRSASTQLAHCGTSPQELAGTYMHQLLQAGGSDASVTSSNERLRLPPSASQPAQAGTTC
eukprot:8769524-Pyramimonas_sp.AAC.1